jgi:prepilin-type N-terminal cleavage/methylation domain-containing protein
MKIKNNGFTLIELLIVLIIILQMLVIYVRVTNPEWSVNLENSYPYLGISGFTALFGLFGIQWIKKKKYGYLSFAVIFLAVGWLVKIYE